MANTVSAQVTNLEDVLSKYDKIKVYRADEVDGTFSEITNSGNRISLNDQDTLYDFIDVLGLTTHFYKTSYFNSDSNQESELSSAVAATAITNQLLENMQVIILLSKNIASSDGISLGADKSYYFTTIYNPLYSTVRKLRLEIGAFIKDVVDDVLNLAIFEASLMADQIGFAVNQTDFFRFARKEWVTCKAAQILLNNIAGKNGGVKSKRLDNFETTYDTKIVGDILNKINDCLARWEVQLVSGGQGTQTPRFVVKGEFDPDAPHVGRMWQKPFPHTPGVNQRFKPAFSRRYVGAWRRYGGRFG